LKPLKAKKNHPKTQNHQQPTISEEKLFQLFTLIIFSCHIQTHNI